MTNISFMRLLEPVGAEEVQKCWIMHEARTRNGQIEDRVEAILAGGDYAEALFSFRGYYARSIFKEIKEWRKVKIDLADIGRLEHVHCELDNLSKGTLRLEVAAENIVNNPWLADQKENPDSWRSARNILDNLEELAESGTPSIIGRDTRSENVRLYDGFHRLVATLVYYRYRKLGTFVEKDAYYGSV
jgi:hypothetical protein